MIRECRSCGQKNRVPSEHLHQTGTCGKCKAPLIRLDEPIAVDAEQFDEIISKARVPVLVDFWAAWCGPCRLAEPEVKKVASQLAGKALALMVDTEAHPKLAARYSIRGIPNFIVFRHGKIFSQQAGLADARTLQGWLEHAAESDGVASEPSVESPAL